MAWSRQLQNIPRNVRKSHKFHSRYALTTEMPTESIHILHTNDLHGRLDAHLVDAIRPFRDKSELFFDTGDCIKTGNLGIPIKPEPVWELLASLGCSASVPGNRESHVLRSTLDAKLEGHVHPVLCANLYDKSGERVLPASLTLEVKGLRVGVFGVMVPMVTDKMASRSLSQLLWTQPVPEAKSIAADLRRHCDLVIALTHIGLRHDQALAEACSEIDLILGGHSHTVLEQPVRVSNAWICQGGSHGRYFGEYVWTPQHGLTEARLHPWDTRR